MGLIKEIKILPFILSIVIFSSCGSSPSLDQITISDYSVYVEEEVAIEVAFTGQIEEVTYSFNGDNLRIIDQKIIIGQRSNTQTLINASTASGLHTTFLVDVIEEQYLSHTSYETSQGWMDPIEVLPVSTLAPTRDFPLGIDISMTKQIYDRGGMYFNDEGKSQSLYQILKSHGVNYVRFRLWHDPFNHIVDPESSTVVEVPYGGGICDLPTVLDMAIGAKAAGLKILLDFHFSDFWADPGKQIIPKAWAELSTPEEVGSALEQYVTDTLLVFQAKGVLPEMVQLGNETTSGLLTSYPGPVNEELTGNGPYYSSQSTPINDAIKGNSGSANFLLYIQSALAGVKAVSEDIKTMIHLAWGFSHPIGIINYFNQFETLDFDIIGLSAYSFWQFQTGFASLQYALWLISSAFPNKLITLAETSYGFTYAPHANANNIFWTGGNQELTGYPVSVQGQANMLRDVIEAVADIPNGYGVFYWEGAWLPIEGAGWADEHSKASWSNQALFTYDGKALPSLDTFYRVIEN